MDLGVNLKKGFWLQAGPLHLHAAFVSNVIDLVESFRFWIAEDISEIFWLCSLELQVFSEIWIFLEKDFFFLFPSPFWELHAS